MRQQIICTASLCYAGFLRKKICWSSLHDADVLTFTISEARAARMECHTPGNMFQQTAFVSTSTSNDHLQTLEQELLSSLSVKFIHALDCFLLSITTPSRCRCTNMTIWCSVRLSETHDSTDKRDRWVWKQSETYSPWPSLIQLQCVQCTGWNEPGWTLHWWVNVMLKCTGLKDLIKVSALVLFPYQMHLACSVFTRHIPFPSCDSDYLFANQHKLQKAALRHRSAALIWVTWKHGSKSDQETVRRGHVSMMSKDQRKPKWLLSKKLPKNIRQLTNTYSSKKGECVQQLSREMRIQICSHRSDSHHQSDSLLRDDDASQLMTVHVFHTSYLH